MSQGIFKIARWETNAFGNQLGCHAEQISVPVENPCAKSDSQARATLRHANGIKTRFSRGIALNLEPCVFRAPRHQLAHFNELVLSPLTGQERLTPATSPRHVGGF